MTSIRLHAVLWRDEESGSPRRGSLMTLGLFCLVVCMTFVAFSVDVGMISLTQTRLQNAVDAAALAAAMEITFAVENAGDDVQDTVAYAQAQAAAKAVEVAQLNGVYVDPVQDVEFGHRSYNAGTGSFQTQWGASPSNVVRVHARRDNDDTSAPDGKLALLFAGVGGNTSASMHVSAVAYVEARDIVTVLDFSRSMNFDSFFSDEFLNPSAQLPQAELEANMLTVWQDLGSPTYGNMSWTPNWVTIPLTTGEVNVTFKDTQATFYAVDYDSSGDFSQVKLYYANGNTETKNPSYPGTRNPTYQGSGSNSGQRITKVEIKDNGNWETIDLYSNTHVKRGLGLTNVTYPFASGSWDTFIAMCREHSSSATSYYQAEVANKGYRRKFGMMLFIQYVLRFQPGYNQTKDLWKTRHYPFHSMKEGEQLFCDFLENLNFDDHMGMVSYDSSHRVESTLSGTGMPSVNISSTPISADYDAYRTIIEHKQAAHYSYATNMGGGLKDAKWLLDNHRRQGARPTILLMTDGNTNTMDSGESSSLPSGWSWNELFDYDADGSADYTTSDSQKKYALKMAKQAVDAGYTIHTMSVGADADRPLMEAIAWLGGGIWVDVPGGTSVSEMQSDIEDAFRRIAAFVPPAKLLQSDE